MTTKTYSLRQSQWSGWLQDLDSIKMEYTDTTPTEEGDIKGKYELRIASAKDPVTGQTLSPQASVWVGPIATAGTGANVKYTPLTTDDIYEPSMRPRRPRRLRAASGPRMRTTSTSRAG